MKELDYSKQGGPAFPGENPPESWGDPTRGMSLRDWFAGQVIASAAANYGFNDFGANELSVHAYRVADAMIRERDRGG